MLKLLFWVEQLQWSFAQGCVLVTAETSSVTLRKRNYIIHAHSDLYAGASLSRFLTSKKVSKRSPLGYFTRRTLDIDYKWWLLPGEVFWYDDCMCMGLYSSCIVSYPCFGVSIKMIIPTGPAYVIRRCFEWKRDTLVWPWGCSAPAVFPLFMRSTCSCYHASFLIYFLFLMGHKTWACCAVDVWHLCPSPQMISMAQFWL